MMRGAVRARIRATMRIASVMAAGAVAACATVPFERYISQQRWSEAAAAFEADSSLLVNERALFEAGMLFSSPTSGQYDPARGRALLRRLLGLFPETSHRVDARDRLAFLDSLDAERGRASARALEVEARIATLAADTLRLRTRLDSALTARSAVEKNAAQLEAELRQLRSELERLKQIDLKPRRPPAPR